MWQQSLAEFKQVRFLVIYPVISVAMLVLVYLVKTPMICFVGAFVIGYAAAGGVLQMATATVNDLFPNIKGTITSLVMIASSLCNYTILSAAAKMSSMQVIMMNIVMILAQPLILRALYVRELVGQLLTTLAFGCSIDFSMGLLDWFIPASPLEQWLACLLSIVVLALGVFLEVRAKIFLVAGEGVVSVLAFVTQKKFSLIKNCFDISLVTLAIIISWGEFGTLQGVGAGTVVAAVLVGRFVHLYESRLSFFDRWKVEA